MNLNDLIEIEIVNGYGDANAQAKVCQDIILKAIAESSLNRNITVKGGVVIREKSNNVRRATQDLDLDSIRYPLADSYIDIFINRLNCLEGIIIRRHGEIEELKQQDYRGKRVYTDRIFSDGRYRCNRPAGDIKTGGSEIFSGLFMACYKESEQTDRIQGGEKG